MVRAATNTGASPSLGGGDGVAPAKVPADALATAAFAVAGRFASGATMWCVSATWPEHARHVAVEFVHPVIMGARALPAVALPGPYLVQTVRAAARTGDVLVCVGPGVDTTIVELMQRAPAWGLETVWLGVGERPDRFRGDHLLWADHHNALYNGDLVLLYHVLWELTHVCFEHPGLLRPPVECEEEVCVTCSDEGRVAEIVDATGAEATVRTAQGVERVDISLVGMVGPNDLVLVHAGTAIEVLS